VLEAAMTTAVIDRPTTTPAPQPPGPTRRGWRALLPGRARRSAPPPDPELARIRGLEDVRAVLEGAKTVVERNWVQDAWYVVRDRAGNLKPVGPFGLLLLKRADVAGACLVGAVVHAAAERGRNRAKIEPGPALDTRWATLRETRAEPRPALADRMPSAEARVARVRDLTWWNDQPARTRGDVVDLLDRAVSRTISDAVRPR
jgi:hypothetical protein